MADWQLTGSRDEPWQVTMSRTGDGYVVHLIIAGVMVILPALEAHKLGSALHAASRLDDETSAGVPPMSEVEYGIIHQSDTEPHRENMTEATARAWIAEFEEDGGKAGAFRVIRRTIGPWELVDESPAGGAVSTVADITADHRGARDGTPGTPVDNGVTELAPDESVVVRGVVLTMGELEQLADTKRALEAHRSGVSVSLDHDTGQWTIGVESSAGGGASTREGEDAGLDAEQPPADRGAGAVNTGAPSSWSEYMATVSYCPDCGGTGCDQCGGTGEALYGPDEISAGDVPCGGLGESDPGSGAGYQSQEQEAGGVPPRSQSEGILTTPPAGVLDVEDTCTGESWESAADGHEQR